VTPSTTLHGASIETVLSTLRDHQTFLITSHARPDGDAIGSALGVKHLLDAMGKHTTVAFADPVPASFHHLPGADSIVHTLPSEIADVAVILECDCVARTGFTALPARAILNIDHHLSGRDYGNVNWIDADACAVGAMVYQIAVVSGVKITPAMATCLYAAVLTDTGGFLYSTTTAETFGLAQHLLESGADANSVTDAVYFSTPQSKLRLLGKALERLQVTHSVSWSYVTLADLAQTGATQEDSEGIVNFLIGMENICAAAFLREIEDGQYRVSFRSKGAVDVSRIAATFKGGGHRNASGATLAAPLQDAIDKVLGSLQEACALTGC